MGGKQSYGRKEELLDEFKKAHQVVDELTGDGPVQDDPHDLDFFEEDRLQRLAIKE